MIEGARVVKDEQKDKCCQRWQYFKYFETHCCLHITVAGFANYSFLGPILLRPSFVHIVSLKHLPPTHSHIAYVACNCCYSNLRTSDGGCMAAKLQVSTMCLSADRARRSLFCMNASKQFKRSEFSWSSTAQAAPVPLRASPLGFALCVFLRNS